MSWAYNQIDVYLSGAYDVQDTSVNNSNWVPLSIYGLLHSRPVLTPSTVEGDSISIPGRNGKRLSVINQRTNAKLTFQVIAVDAWPFASLKQQNVMIRDRVNYIKSYVNDAKRVSYKCPGRVANSYFEIIKTTITNLNDADEKVAALEVEMELYPFEFYFEGNQRITIAPSSSELITNTLPFDDCYPLIIFSSSGTNKQGSISITKDSKTYTITYENSSTSQIPSAVNLDIAKEEAYYQKTDGTCLSANRYLSGDDYNMFKIGKGDTVTFTNNFTSDNMYLYTRKGLVV